VSRQSRDMLVKCWGWPEDKTEVIPNGVDTRRFFPVPQKPAEKTVIGSVGHLRPVKNHALILRACSQLIEQGYDIEIRIAGEGAQRSSLEKLSEDLGISRHVVLVGNIEDIPGFLNGLDMFVLSSDSEQHPNALNEAMACGIPCISTRVGCVEDLLDSGKCGMIIEPNDEEALANSIEKLLCDDNFRHALARAGLEQVQKHYCLEVMLKRYEELYFRASGV